MCTIVPLTLSISDASRNGYFTTVREWLVRVIIAAADQEPQECSISADVSPMGISDSYRELSYLIYFSYQRIIYDYSSLPGYLSTAWRTVSLRI